MHYRGRSCLLPHAPAGGLGIFELVEFERRVYDDLKYLSYAPILFKDRLLGAVYVGVNQSVLLKAQQTTRRQIFWLFVITFLLAVIGIFVLSVFITRPLSLAAARRARSDFGAFLETISFSDPKVPLYQNVTGKRSTSAVEVKKLSVEQVVSTVRWVDVERSLLADAARYEALAWAFLQLLRIRKLYGADQNKWCRSSCRKDRSHSQSSCVEQKTRLQNDWNRSSIS
jgi:hypothetical protein